MKSNFKLCVGFSFVGLLTSAVGQYAINWHTIDGGGGTSTGGQYAVSGTIGLHDAGGAMSGGHYSATVSSSTSRSQPRISGASRSLPPAAAGLRQPRPGVFNQALTLANPASNLFFRLNQR